nr:MAG TPA: hypothetical protein [Caudoviricetes sp.]
MTAQPTPYRLHGSFIVRGQKTCIKQGRKIMQLDCYPAGRPDDTVEVRCVQRPPTPDMLRATLRFVRSPYTRYGVGFAMHSAAFYTVFTMNQKFFQTNHVGRSFAIETVYHDTGEGSPNDE